MFFFICYLLVVGNWKMSVYYDGEHISGSPFDVNVFDPAQVQIYGIDGGTVGKELNFKGKIGSTL